MTTSFTSVQVVWVEVVSVQVVCVEVEVFTARWAGRDCMYRLAYISTARGRPQTRSRARMYRQGKVWLRAPDSICRRYDSFLALAEPCSPPFGGSTSDEMSESEPSSTTCALLLLSAPSLAIRGNFGGGGLPLGHSVVFGLHSGGGPGGGACFFGAGASGGAFTASAEPGWGGGALTASGCASADGPLRIGM